MSERREPGRFRQTLRDVYHERTNFEFVGRAWRWGLLSGTCILVSLIALAIGGLNLGIDFTGGTQWQFDKGQGSVDIDRLRDTLDSVGLGDAKVLVVGGSGARIQAEELPPARRQEARTALARFSGVPESEVSVSNVGPIWGNRVTDKAIVALVVFFALIASYLTFRFEWKMALAAIAAVLHDIVITVGVYAVTRFEVTPATVIAFLTILGFSLYDTVVVFDKVRENVATLGTVRADTYSRMVNRSMNQVLMRSLNTSFVAVLPVLSLLVVGNALLGATALRDFALALFVGLLTGAYSSIFVATPLLAIWKEREPRFVAMRERAAAQLTRDRAGAAPGPEPGTVREPRILPVPAPAPAAEPAVAPPRRSGDGSVAPRPRQQRRRRR